MLNNQKNQDSDEIAQDGSSKVEYYKWSDPHSPGKLEWIDKHELKIDPRYQREPSDHKVVKLAADFNWPAFGVLIVARRKSGLLFVAEGQHRYLASLKRSDVKKLPCVVFDSEGVAFEAEIFLDANSNRRPVSSLAKHKASLVTKDEVSLHVEELAKQIGRTIGGGGGGPTAANTLSCVACVTHHAGGANRAALDRVWALVGEIAEGQLLSKRLVDAMVYIESNLPAGVSVTDKRWRERLIRIGCGDIEAAMANAAAFYSEGGARIWASGILQRVNRALKAENQLALVAAPTPEVAAASEVAA